MSLSFQRTAAALLMASAVSLQVSASDNTDTDARIAELERQLSELKTLLINQQNSIQVATERLDETEKTVEKNAIQVADSRITRSGTKLSYGGFIKVDSAISRYSEGKPSNALAEDFMVPSLIPTSSGDGDSYQSYQLHAKTSRLFFRTATDTAVGKVSTHFEMDFAVGAQGNERVSNSWSNRMRHAYVQWDYAPGSSLLAGQAWSTFFNVSALPANLDFVGPVGTIFNRQPQIRWTTGSWMFALENPRTRLNGEAHDDFSEGFPDLVARYNGKNGDLNWSLAAIGRQLSYDNGSADDAKVGYGVSFSGKWLLGADDLRFGLNYGDALGRYLGINAFNDAYVDGSGNIETVDQMGGFVAYRHAFSDRWEGGFTLSLAEADNPDLAHYSAAGSLAKSYRTGHLNLKYRPTDRLEIGGELIYGYKELENGNDGSLNRLLMSVKYGI